MENVLAFLRAAAPWIALGLAVAFLCVRPAIRKENKKTGGDYAAEGMCAGMCLGMAAGSVLGDGSMGLGTSLGMMIGLAVGSGIPKKNRADNDDEK